MRRQLELFAIGAPRFDASYRAMRRIELAQGAWIEHGHWLAGHDALFEELEGSVAWREETMHIYDHTVTVPRLLGSPARTPLIEEMRASLSARYGEEFVRVTAALYRDG